jgi:hypothetical protein
MGRNAGMLDTLYKSYIYKSLYKDVAKFTRKNLKNVDFDRLYWMRKMGVTPYRPTKAAFGASSLFILGALAGSVAALLFAPKTGPEMRTEVKERARTLVKRAPVLMSMGDEMPVRA